MNQPRDFFLFYPQFAPNNSQWTDLIARYWDPIRRSNKHKPKMWYAQGPTSRTSIFKTIPMRNGSYLMGFIKAQTNLNTFQLYEANTNRLLFNQPPIRTLFVWQSVTANTPSLCYFPSPILIVDQGVKIEMYGNDVSPISPYFLFWGVELMTPEEEEFYSGYEPTLRA